MKTPIALSACLLLILAGGPAAAQVTVNPRALDQTPAQPPPQTNPPPAKPAPRPPAARPSTTNPLATRQQPPPAKPPAIEHLPPAPVLMPMVPLTPPPPPVLPAPIVVPTRPPAPPLPATIVADAPGEASTLPTGLRVTFGPGRADLNPSTADAVKALAASIAAKGQADATYTVNSLASGAGDDVSAPRRLSLARGLAIRSLLIGEGIASPRIYVRALGPANDTPADRVDIVVGNTEAAKPPAAPQTRPAP